MECSALLGFEIFYVFFSPSSTSTFPPHQHLSPYICSSLHYVRSLLLNIYSSLSRRSRYFFSFNFSVYRTFPSYLVPHSSMHSSHSICLFTTLTLLLLFGEILFDELGLYNFVPFMVWQASHLSRAAINLSNFLSLKTVNFFWWWLDPYKVYMRRKMALESHNYHLFRFFKQFWVSESPLQYALDLGQITSIAILSLQSPSSSLHIHSYPARIRAIISEAISSESHLSVC